MKYQSGLKSIESAAYRSFLKDGIWDLFWGLTLLIAGVNKYLYTMGIERPLVVKLGILWLIPLFFLGRIFITHPRLGKAKFGRTRKKRKAAALGVAMLTQVVFGILFYFAVSDSPLREDVMSFFTPLAEFLVLVVVFSLLGYLIGYNLFYLFGLSLALAWPVSTLINETVQAPFLGVYILGISGCIITVTGIIHLILFLRRYPKQIISIDHEK